MYIYYFLCQSEVARLRSELGTCRTKLSEAERVSASRAAELELARQRGDDALDQLRLATSQLQVMKVWCFRNFSFILHKNKLQFCIKLFYLRQISL